MQKKIKNCLWKKWMVCIGLMVLLWGLYPVSMKCVKTQRDLDHLVKDNFSFIYQVDKVLNEENVFILEGWAFKLEEEATEGAMELWLYDLEEEKIVYPQNTKYTKRLDVNEYFLCEYDYTNCGIVAGFDKNKLFLTSKGYEILVFDVNNASVYQTGNYIYNGELMPCLPEEYIPLDVTDTDIEEIVSNGILKVYRPDVGIYVYQYEADLYWIAEPYYSFADDDSVVLFQMNTTQIDKLPKESLDNQWSWGSIGFLFKSRELTEWNTGKYRVSTHPLPTEYSITKIWTGNYIIGEWKWIQYFRPWYDLTE